VPAEATQSGGSVQSTDYAADSVIGGWGGIGTATAPTAKHGYAGQLYEVTGVSLSAVPETVNEGATRQASAAADLDDDTVLALQNTDPAWTVAGWPLASVSGDGLVVASNVYEGVSGTVFAAYGSVTGSLYLLVLNTDNDNFGSYAMDGLDDGWQVQYFGIGNPDAAPWLDPDDDGQSNRYERIVGTDPTTNASLFAMWIESVSGISTQVDLVFDPTFADREYTVRRSAALMSGSWSNLVVFAESTNGTERTVRDLNATNPAAFYDVWVTFTP